jgi:hypothetical protein
MGLKKIIAGVWIAGLVAIVAAGCGGGGSDSSSEGNSPESSPSGSTKNSSKSGKSGGAKPEPGPEPKSPPSTEFLGKGENGKLATLGREADDEEREEASKVIEESFLAREAGDWEVQCATLSAEVIEQSEKAAAVLGAKQGCAKALEAQAEAVPEEALANPMTGPIDVLRTSYGLQAFAFFHGAEGKDYVVPLKKEGGEWKVAALQEQEIR